MRWLLTKSLASRQSVPWHGLWNEEGAIPQWLLFIKSWRVVPQTLTQSIKVLLMFHLWVDDFQYLNVIILMKAKVFPHYTNIYQKNSVSAFSPMYSHSYYNISIGNVLLCEGYCNVHTLEGSVFFVNFTAMTFYQLYHYNSTKLKAFSLPPTAPPPSAILFEMNFWFEWYLEALLICLHSAQALSVCI